MALGLICVIPGAALSQSNDIAYRGHSAWSLRAGTLPAYPRAIAQTPDGYLWLATEAGLLKFDGIQFTPWRQRDGEPPLPGQRITALHVGRDGSLWIGSDEGLARRASGVVTTYPQLAGDFVAVVAETRDGTIWAATNAGRGAAKLCSIREDAVECHGKDGALGRYVLSLHEGEDGALWIGASNGLWRWTNSQRTIFEVPDGSEIHAIVGGEGGAPIVAVNREVLQLTRGAWRRYESAAGAAKPTALLRDRHGGLWIGTQDRGVLHIRDDATHWFSRVDGLSGDFVLSLFEDKEGSIWVGTLNGLDRLRDIAAIRLSVEHGLSDDTIMAVQAGSTGNVWLGTINGLNEWRDGHVRRYAIPGIAAAGDIGSLFEDSRGQLWVSSVKGLFHLRPSREGGERIGGVSVTSVHAMVEDSTQKLWISDLRTGLVAVQGEHPAEVLPWSRFGGKDARALAADAAGGVWLGFSQSGVAYLKEGQVVRTIGEADGLAGGRVNGLHLDRDGVLWVAAQEGLSRVTAERVDTMREAQGLPCDAVHWAIEDAARGLWLYTTCGLAHIQSADLREWEQNPRDPARLVVYDTADNVPRSSDLGGYGPKVTRAADGRLWFATYEGAGIVDPGHLPTNLIPPPVHVELITADRIEYDASTPRELPPLIRDLRLDYTALSLVAPEKNRFRYKLEGRDLEWVDAGDRRHAYYTDLPAGKYRFRVVAANNHGVWNDVGATWEFSIAPTFYQTTAFRVFSVLLLLAGMYALYQLRVRRLAAQLNYRFEERLAERTRIAQELHDTLLQGFISSSMQLRVFAKQVTDERARQELTRILQRVAEVIVEGRQAVQGLRAPAREPLERALARSGEHFRGAQEIDIHVEVKGEAQPLSALAYDTAYQIGREALANAFRHARASRVEVDIDYARDGLYVRVRDDGSGIEPEVIESGRAGHWGLRNMRDRAEQIGGTLKLWSGAAWVGTEMELRIPRQIAFDLPGDRASPP